MTDGLIRREVLAGLLAATAISTGTAASGRQADPPRLRDDLQLDFRRDRYLLNGREQGSTARTPGLTARHPGGLALTPDGRLLVFSEGAARLDDRAGLLLEAASWNRAVNHNAAPVTTEGWSLPPSMPAGATWTVVDRRADLYNAVDPQSGTPIFRALIDAGVMNGKVLQGYNPAPGKTVLVSADGSTGVTGPHALSAWVRCVSGSGDLRLSGAAAGPQFDHSDWRRSTRPNLAATSREQTLTVAIHPLSTVEIVLWQIEPGECCTSPIVVAGAAAPRSADRLSITDSRLFASPFKALMDAHINHADAVDRLWLMVSGAGDDITVTRTKDRALTLSGSGDDHDASLLPRIPRIQGPGAARVALQVKPQGRIVSVGGVNAHDPFSVMPQGLDTLVVGARPDGSAPLNGWLRTLGISAPLSEADLKSASAPPPDGMAHDICRYVDPDGDDAADGLTPATAWKSLAKVAATGLPSGSHVLLKRGGSWSETLYPPTLWGTVGAYGTGPRPIIGVGQDFGCDENGKSGFRLEDLHLTGWLQRGFNNSGSDSHMLWNLEVGPIAPGQPETNRLGVASRHFRNFYIGASHIHDVIGDDVFLQDTAGGWILSEGNRYDPANGSAADNFQVSQNTGARVRLSGDTYDMRGADGGKGNIVLGGGASAVIEDFRCYGHNFAIGADCDNTIIRRGQISGSRLNAYSWGVGAGGTTDVRNHLYEDLVIEDCNRAIACSGTGGGPSEGPARIDFVARRITARNNLVGLFVDRPTSGDLSDITYEGNDTDKVVNTRTVPTGGDFGALTL